MLSGLCERGGRKPRRVGLLQLVQLARLEGACDHVARNRWKEGEQERRLAFGTILRLFLGRVDYA